MPRPAGSRNLVPQQGSPGGDIPSHIARAYQAMELHTQGYTFEEIRDICGFKTLRGTFAAIQCILGRAFNPGIKRHREAIRRRIEKLYKTYYPLAVGMPANEFTGEPEVPPNLDAADYCRRLMKDYRDLFGIDKPRKVTVKTTSTSTSVEVLVADLTRQGVALPRGLEHLQHQITEQVLEVPNLHVEEQESAK